MKFTISNYRTFSSSHPLKFEIHDGVTSFVGMNNTGKSSILKFFFEFRDLFGCFPNLNSLINNNAISLILKGLNDKNEIFHKFNDENIFINLEIENIKIEFEYNRSNILKSNSVKVDNIYIDNHNRNQNLNLIANTSEIISFRENYQDGNEKIFTIESKILDEMKCFLNSQFYPAFRNIINRGSHPSYYDIEIGEAFVKKWNDLSSGTSAKNRENCLQIQNDLKELFGYNGLEIRSSTDNKNLVINVDGKSYNLQELGSGLSQFILVFINAAIYKPTYILIDEPELNLHPKLQIDFITRLITYAKKGIILSTHSIGLAKSISNKIYTLQKSSTNKNETLIKPLSKNTNYLEFLGELSFSNYTELGFKKLLLVEGPTDVLVFSSLLKKVGKYKDFLIWNLGGSGMINPDTGGHLAELKRLGEEVEIYCWIDSEKKDKDEAIATGRARFISNCKKLGITTKASDKRAIENYFPIEKIKSINPKIESLDSHDPIPEYWDKGSNWRIIEKMSFKDIEETDLGSFIKNL